MDALDGLLGVPATDADPTDPLVGTAVVSDTALDRISSAVERPLAVHLTGGAGQITGPARMCRRRDLPLASLTTSLRDLDDLAGNARRVVAAVESARAGGDLDPDVGIGVVLPDPGGPIGHGWLAAADELAAAELDAALPASYAGGADVGPAIDALLDRELGFAVLDADSPDRVLALLAATAAAWDGAGPDDVTAAATDPLPRPSAEQLTTGRRWCRSVTVGPGVVAGLRARIERM